MDRRGKTFLGFFAATLVLVSAASAADTKHPLRAMAWLAPEGRLEALTTEPSSGFRINPEMLAQSDQIIAGEVLFHSPSLLGGQAAKAGINCASCHVSGRNNPNFLFPGVSGAPGTADITHSFFSSYRGDGEFNPVPIPDLTSPGKISRERKGALSSFIRELIVEEFDGAEPDPSTLQAVTMYVKALCNDCDNRQEPVTLDSQWQRTERAIIVAEKFQPKEPQLARSLIASARHQLGLVHERYAGEKLAKERRQLIRLSSTMLQLQKLVAADAGDYRKLSSSLMGQMIKAEKHLIKAEKYSLYNRAVLNRSLAVARKQF